MYRGSKVNVQLRSKSRMHCRNGKFLLDKVAANSIAMKTAANEPYVRMKIE
jgi:hypothetical protein